MGIFAAIILTIASIETLILLTAIILAVSAFKREKLRQQQIEDSLDNHTAAFRRGIEAEEKKYGGQKNSCNSTIGFNISDATLQEAKSSAARQAIREIIKISNK